MRRNRSIAGLFLGAAALIATGCLHAHHPARPSGHRAEAHRHGPPPHAPAHGYRHKHGHGTELVFDSRVGVYVVGGRSDHYYDSGSWYRHVDGAWQVSIELDGPWRFVSVHRLPGTLAYDDHPSGHKHKTKHKKAKHRHHGHPHGAAKGKFD